MMELKETVGLMLSEDYKDRFRAEAAQLSIRVKKLQDVLEKHESGKLGFELSCPVELLKEQLAAMVQYLLALCARSEIEGIEVINIMRC